MALQKTIHTIQSLRRTGKILNNLAEIATREVQKTRVFTFSDLCKIKTPLKPASKAWEMEDFRKAEMVKAKCTRKVVKGFQMTSEKTLLNIFL